MDTEDTRRVELAVRTLAPRGSQQRQSAVIQRLRALEGRGVLDSFEVTVWGERVGLTTAGADTDHGQEIVDAVDSFEEWAADYGLSIEQFFETREVHSGYTGEEYTTMELPSMVLAEYRDGDLHWVSPCVDDDRVYSVHDRVEMLESATENLEQVSEPPRGRLAQPVAEE